MRSFLGGVRRRVDLLEREIITKCNRDHQVVRFDKAFDGKPLPPWPEAESGASCVCGTPLTFRRVVLRLLSDATLAARGRIA